MAGERIYKSRIEKSLTIKELSIHVNIHKNQLSYIELGKSIPRISTLKALAVVLRKEFWWLGGYDMLPEDTLGDRIYKCRLMHGYTQKEFAEVLGVMRMTVNDWEKNRCKPSNKHMQNLNTYLDILNKKLHII